MEESSVLSSDPSSRELNDLSKLASYVELDWPTSLETPTKSLFASSVAI
jgi:hypothetical protein